MSMSIIPSDVCIPRPDATRRSVHMKGQSTDTAPSTVPKADNPLGYFTSPVLVIDRTYHWYF